MISEIKLKCSKGGNLDCVREDASTKETQDRKDSDQKQTSVDEAVDFT